MKKKSIKKILVVSAVFLIVIIVLAANLLKPAAEVEYATFEVKPEKLLQTVSETGTVKSTEEVALSFMNTGKIDKIMVSVGDKAAAGQVLAELDHSALEIRKSEAEANLEVAKSNLKKLKSGATSEEIAIEQAGVAQAEASYNSAVIEFERTQSVLAEAVKQAEKTVSDLENETAVDKTPSEQAIETASDNLENTKSIYQNAVKDSISSSLVQIGDKTKVANTALDKIDLVITDEYSQKLLSAGAPEYLSKTKADYETSLLLLAEIKAQFQIINEESPVADVLLILGKTKKALNTVFSSLSNCFNALENTVTSNNYSLAERETDKTTISAQMTILAAAVTAIDNQIQGLNSSVLTRDTKISAAENSLREAQTAYNNALQNAKNALSSAQLNREQQLALSQSRVGSSFESWQVAKTRLARLKAPADRNDIELNEAKIRQAEAALASINRQIEDSFIKSGMAGVVTDIKFEVGEQVAAGNPVITLLGDNKYDIEVLISEADIAKVKIADAAEITLDAFGDDEHMLGSIVFIEPAETVIQDVIYYKVDITFEAGEVAVKSGMTANVMITTAEKDQALAIPNRAIIDRNGDGKFVRVLEAGTPREVKVNTGLKGDGGLMEITDGLKAGDVIVTSVIEKKK